MHHSASHTCFSLKVFVHIVVAKIKLRHLIPGPCLQTPVGRHYSVFSILCSENSAEFLSSHCKVPRAEWSLWLSDGTFSELGKSHCFIELSKPNCP